MKREVFKKYINLKKNIARNKNVLVAFSGGVDSALLLMAAVEALGGKNVVAVTAVSEIRHKAEAKRAAAIASRLGAKHVIIKSDELSIPEVRANGRKRCYLCKKNIFSGMIRRARKKGISSVLEASTRDDLASLRPGRRAVRELGIESPLCDAGFSKKDVREVLRESGLGIWDAPSESCLLTRFPYGREIKVTDIDRVRKTEQVLAKMGFSQVRVRTYGDMARIEVSPDGIRELLSGAKRKRIIRAFRRAGYKHIAVDMEGFRSGSMDE